MATLEDRVENLNFTQLERNFALRMGEFVIFDRVSPTDRIFPYPQRYPHDIIIAILKDPLDVRSYGDSFSVNAAVFCDYLKGVPTITPNRSVGCLWPIPLLISELRARLKVTVGDREVRDEIGMMRDTAITERDLMDLDKWSRTCGVRNFRYRFSNP